MLEFVIYLGLEAVFIIFSISIQRYFLRDWKVTRNKIPYALFFFMMAYIASAIFSVLSGILPPITIGARLNLIYINALVIFAIVLNLIFYFLRLKKLYSLPVLISFYVGFGLVLVDSNTAFIIMASSISFLGSIVFIIEGKRNRNGLALTLGIFITIYGFSEISSSLIITGILRLIAVIILSAGASGFIDRYFLVDEQEENKIKNVWIARMVSK